MAEEKHHDVDPHHSICFLCQKSFPLQQLVSGELVRKEIAHEIKRESPGWNSAQSICYDDLARMRSRYVHFLLLSERKELTHLDKAVLDSIREHELLSENTEDKLEQQRTLGERVADRIARFGGSWQFILFFFVFLMGWMLANTYLLWLRPSDPYPFIFLNLILSCLAAIQAPVIMMSQNRKEAKDRIRSEHDYQTNLKAELEIRHLHEKVDHLLSYQWEKMVRIQEIQLEILTELGHQKK